MIGGTAGGSFCGSGTPGGSPLEELLDEDDERELDDELLELDDDELLMHGDLSGSIEPQGDGPVLGGPRPAACAGSGRKARWFSVFCSWP